MTRRGRVGLYDRHNEFRAARLAAMTPEQRAAKVAADKLKLLEPVATAPVVGDPDSIDWLACDCGYTPLTDRNGKVLPQTRQPAWRWTEEKNTSGRPYLRGAVKDLALKVYRIGYRHNPIELHSESGFPDDLFWGRFGPRLIIREFKAMRVQWKRGQKQHLLSLQEAGLDVAVRRPCCLLSGLIDEEFAQLAGVKPKGTYARRVVGTPNRAPTWQDIAEGALTEGVE